MQMVLPESDHRPSGEKKGKGEKMLKGISNPGTRDHKSGRGKLQVTNLAVITNLKSKFLNMD